MTQQKSESQNSWSEVVKKFKALPKDSQEAVTTFFNLHNAAIWLYNGLPEDARVYVDNCIEMSRENTSAENVEQV